MVERLGDPTLAAKLQGQLSLPIVVAPMFLVSGPELVVASIDAGVVGALPSLNARTTEIFEEWMTRIAPHANGRPYCVNLIVHPTNKRLDADLDVCVRHRAPIVLAAVGNPSGVVAKVHAYGGIVIADVASVKHARRAAASGVDGLILLTAGAGGNTGWLNPFAFVSEVRRFWDGPLFLAGAISTGRFVHVAQEMGADFAIVGTPFIAAKESLAVEAYRQMLVECNADDILTSKEVTGIPANFLRPSLERAGFKGAGPHKGDGFDIGRELETLRAWRDIWAAGHGVGDVQAIETTAEIVTAYRADYEKARSRRP